MNAPKIRVVVHVGMVLRLRDYAQESGRAGRDGQASEVIVVWGAAKTGAGWWRRRLRMRGLATKSRE